MFKTVVVSALVMFSFGCAEEQKTTCDNYCDLLTTAAYQDAEDKLCHAREEDLNRFEASCLNTCTDVLDYVVDKEERADADTCLKCIYTKAEATEQGIAAAREDCFKICNTLGGYQFFYSFYVFPPWWDCD
jgi:hypothetical protein